MDLSLYWAKRSKKAFPNKDEMRLCIFKSSNHIEAQIIDDFNSKTIVSASSKEKKLIVCFGSLYNAGNILNKN